LPNRPIKVPIDRRRTMRERESQTRHKLAIGLLAIPGTCCECERVFSQAGKLATGEHNRLGPKVIKTIELQKDWPRKGVIESPILQLIGWLHPGNPIAGPITHISYHVYHTTDRTSVVAGHFKAPDCTKLYSARTVAVLAPLTSIAKPFQDRQPKSEVSPHPIQMITDHKNLKYLIMPNKQLS
jgi:hAT family C-terminal dimerisation region